MSSRTLFFSSAVLACACIFVGCSSFYPLEDMAHLDNLDPGIQRIEVFASNGNRFIFPKNQYRVEKRDDSHLQIMRWGEEFGKFGLVGRGFYAVPVSAGTLVKVEEVDVARSVVFGGLLTGVGVITYLGIKSLSVSSGDESGSTMPPAEN
jgi:hypothetical protein